MCVHVVSTKSTKHTSEIVLCQLKLLVHLLQLIRFLYRVMKSFEVVKPGKNKTIPLLALVLAIFFLKKKINTFTHTLVAATFRFQPS